MLTKLIIRNFKRFKEVEVELGNPVVFIGPNNSGKTTALQALALWDIGLKRWHERYGGQPVPANRAGVVINRRDLLSLPVSSARLLWHDLTVRRAQHTGKRTTQNIRIDMILEGVTNNKAWQCGLEFDYANAESFHVRPLRKDNKATERMPVPPEASQQNIAFLPPMSGLADREFMKQVGEVNFLIGQGRTAEVLRNLCFQAAQRDAKAWQLIQHQIQALFGVQMLTPRYIPERSEIEMVYKSRSGVQLDLASSGRGLQQTLLLLTFLATNPNSILLLDEPDAHLEILRQRQIYQILTESAQRQRSQIVAASHSEVILNEAASRDVVVAFVGNKPHRIDDRGNQLLKSLHDISFDQYYQAELKGWVLYLEGSTDLAILQAFAKKLDHPAQTVLEQPFVHYVANHQGNVEKHFYGLREAVPTLGGFVLFDRLAANLPNRPKLTQHMWTKCEIENYLCYPETLLNWAKAQGQEGPLFANSWAKTMQETMDEIEQALATIGKESPWGNDTKVSDDFLTPLFTQFYRKVNLPNLMRKTNFHTLTNSLPDELIDNEVVMVLDNIVQVANQAQSLALPE